MISNSYEIMVNGKTLELVSDGLLVKAFFGGCIYHFDLIKSKGSDLCFYRSGHLVVTVPCQTKDIAFVLVKAISACSLLENVN